MKEICASLFVISPCITLDKYNKFISKTKLTFCKYHLIRFPLVQFNHRMVSRGLVLWDAFLWTLHLAKFVIPFYLSSHLTFGTIKWISCTQVPWYMSHVCVSLQLSADLHATERNRSSARYLLHAMEPLPSGSLPRQDAHHRIRPREQKWKSNYAALRVGDVLWNPFPRLLIEVFQWTLRG